MSDLETMVRDSLNDDRRRLSPPHDASGWVRAAARRQRRRNAVVGAVVASLLAAGAAGVLVPMLTDTEATYVAGLPPAESGLLAWEPVGSVDDAPEIVAAAIDAWEEQADDQPAGPVYLVAGEQGETTIVVLQAESDSGVASLAALTTDLDSPDWTLRGVTAIPEAPNAVEALYLPATPEAREQAALLLGPEWRDQRMQRDADVGWQLAPVEPGTGETPQWQPLETAAGLPWWAPLSVGDEGTAPSTVVLEPTGRDMAGLAKVLDLPSADEMSAVVASDVSLRLLRREDSSPESLDEIAEVIGRLGLSGPVEVTVLHTASGAVSVDRKSDTQHADTEPTLTLFAAYDSDSLDRPLLVAYATTGGEVTCFSQRSLPAEGLSGMPYVGFGCPLPVGGGPERGIQGNLLWARSLLVEPELGHSVVDISVRLVRANGESTTHELPGGGTAMMLTENADAPVTRYVFTGTETFDFTELDPWVWPGTGDSSP
jgi:hypothetical protein